jgi:hypothetical protein
MIARCCDDGQWHQALGICVEARRLQKLEHVARQSDDLAASLRHVLKASQVSFPSAHNRTGTHSAGHAHK